MRLTGTGKGGGRQGVGYSMPEGEKPEKAFILRNSSRTVGLEMGYRTQKLKWKRHKKAKPLLIQEAVLTKKSSHSSIMSFSGNFVEHHSPLILGNSNVASRHMCPVLQFFKLFFS